MVPLRVGGGAPSGRVSQARRSAGLRVTRLATRWPTVMNLRLPEVPWQERTIPGTLEGAPRAGMTAATWVVAEILAVTPEGVAETGDSMLELR